MLVIELMNISFGSRKLQSWCNDPQVARKSLGDEQAKKLHLRTNHLRAAENLAVMFTMPGRCHPLTGDRQGQFAVDLVGPYRLIFRPNEEPIPILTSGGIDCEKVTSILLLEVVDYHV